MINDANTAHADCNCLSWKPIFVGALVAVGLTFLLNLFSVAIGLTAFTTNHEGVETLALGGLLGVGIGIITSMFAAGWLTGYLGQQYCKRRHLGALYGFLAWCVSLIIAVFLTSYAQHYIFIYSHALSGTAHLVQVGNMTNAVSDMANNVETKGLVISTYIIFILFFLSAFACSLGGHCGMCHVCKKDTSCKVC